MTALAVLTIGAGAVRGREAPPIAIGTPAGRLIPGTVPGSAPPRTPPGGAGPTVVTTTSSTTPSSTTTTTLFPPTCAGGTRIEGEAAVLGDWEIATSPTGYSGTGFASNPSQLGGLSVTFPALSAGYYEVRTRDITGGDGATRRMGLRVGNEYVRLEPGIWATHNSWGITEIGTWLFPAGTTSFGIGEYFVGAPAGFLGIDWIEICPVVNPTVRVYVQNSAGAYEIAVTFECASGSEATRSVLMVPAGEKRSFVAPLAATCAVSHVTSLYNTGWFSVQYVPQVGDERPFREAPLAYINPVKLDKYIGYANGVWFFWNV